MTRIGGALWTALSITLLFSPSIAQGKCGGWDLNGDWTIVSSAGTSIFHLKAAGDIEGTVETKNEQGLLGGVWHGKVFGKLGDNSLQLNVYWETGASTVFIGTIDGIGRLEGYSYQVDNPGKREIWNTSRKADCWLTSISDLCQQYGETSVKQFNENVTLNCGFKDMVKGILWKPKATDYWEHCRLLPNDTLDMETKARDTALARCRELHQNVESIDKPDAPDHQLIDKKLGRAAKPKFGPLVPHQPVAVCDAARQALARNSPAAPGLEAQCRAAGGTP